MGGDSPQVTARRRGYGSGAGNGADDLKLDAEQSAPSSFRETMTEDGSFVFQPAIAPAVSCYDTTTRGPSPGTL